MSRHDYEMSRQIAALDGVTFYGVLMAAMRMADTQNTIKLLSVFPDTYHELDARYNAPGGVLDTDPGVTSDR